MSIIPTLEVFRNQREGGYSLLNYAVNPLNQFTVGWGKFVHASEAEMKSRGLDLVLANLAEFSSRDGSGKCDLDRMPSAARRRFLSTHKSISVFLPDPNRLMLQGTTRHSATGSAGMPEQRIEMRLPMPQTSFYSALIRAFDLTE